MEVLCSLPSTHYPLYDFDLRATHARTLLPAELASVPFGFVLVRVQTAGFTNTITEIDLEPVCAYCFSNYRLPGPQRSIFSEFQVNLNFNAEFNSE